MTHYVRPHEPVSVTACGLIAFGMPRRDRVTIFRRGITCASCRKLLGLRKRKRHTAANGEAK